MNTPSALADLGMPFRRNPKTPTLLRALGFALLAAVPALTTHAADPVLTVASADKAITFSADDFRALPHSEITATDPHLKLEHRYSGVPVRDLLAKLDAPLGEKLRGPALQMAVIFHSKDGYSTLYALAEFDEAFSDRTILLVDSEDGKPLPENAGPIRVVAPGDKRAARWARMVTSVELVRPQGKTDAK
jgi:DMSO/TMAO reductase YedYZ molybdopterin-dependent catalytic subunit